MTVSKLRDELAKYHNQDEVALMVDAEIVPLESVLRGKTNEARFNQQRAILIPKHGPLL